MDADSIARLIGTLGFPIAMCIWFVWRDWKLMSTFSSKLDKIIYLLELAIKLPVDKANL